jgi:hypothetical protein
MGLETGTYIDALNPLWPLEDDFLQDVNEHLQFMKSTLQATFPNIDGAVNPTPAELNLLVGKTSVASGGDLADYLALAGGTLTGDVALTAGELSAIPATVNAYAGNFYSNVSGRNDALVSMHQDHATAGGNNAPVLRVTQDSTAAGIALTHNGASGNALTVVANSSGIMNYFIQSGSGLAVRVTGDVQFDDGINAAGLPTSAGAAGTVWNDGGTLKVS